MAVFRCKMCGAPLEIEQGVTVAVCSYCETKQTLPKLDDEKRSNLYDRANHFRRNNDFDKAENIYEKILNEDNTDAEAYWSLVLCRYGIEYVEDPKTHKRLPTINRTQFTSIYDDDNYKSAIKHADAGQKSVYEEEADAINSIQKSILEISRKEDPFDVFICYKETDSNGRRTPDSVYAQELYYLLKEEGYKVFFSRITLEDKLGTAYEPYIFAALNSAKAMVVLGTKEENFNAVWVKNEWSRYLSLIKNGEKKTLIPAYKDMDPYDLPEEFSHLQAQDMSKLGFMQDLIRGIKKIVGESAPQPIIRETVVANAPAVTNTAPLLERAFMFLEDGDFVSANEYCEKVLDLEPKNAEAYLGKLMVDLKVRKREDLKNCREQFSNFSNYQKAYRFGDDALKEEFRNYIEFIQDRNLNYIYDNAVSMMNSATTEKAYKAAAEEFKRIPDHRDSKALYKECLEKAEEAKLESTYNYALSLKNSATVEESFKKAADMFLSLGDYKDSDALTTECLKKAKEIKNDKILDNALVLKKSSLISAKEEAIELLESISGWKDADKLCEYCKKEIEDIRTRAKLEAEKAEKKREKIFIIIAIAVTLFALLVILINVISNVSSYDKAIDLMEAGKYSEAIVAFKELGGYKDSKEKINECKYNMAVEAEKDSDKATAAILFGQAGDHKDAEERSFALWDEIAVRETVSAGEYHTVALKKDGTVVAVGLNGSGRCDVENWKDIVAISAGRYHTVGLKKDGTVVAVGDNSFGQRDVEDWEDIVAISASEFHTVGLKKDGTVVAVGWNSSGQCDVEDWEDIVAISAGEYHTVGLKKDDTVVATEYIDDPDYSFDDYKGQCDVEDWEDIVAISAGVSHTVGLKKDGTVVAVGDNDDGQCDVEDWEDIVAISAGWNHTVGLKKYGTVVATEYTGTNYDGECDVDGWKDIVAISAGDGYTVALTKDGTVVAVGDNYHGECDVDDWENIKIPE